MSRRLLVGVTLAVAFGLGAYYAWQAGFVRGAELLFNSGAWLVFLAPFAGILAAGFTHRRDPRIEGDRILRHDDAAILEHWTHGLGTAALLVTGISLGLFFIPNLLPRAHVPAMMNLHFVAVIPFLFGTFYYATNTLLARKRFAEHLPTANAVRYTIAHYSRLLGNKKYDMPPEDKYFESEKMAYILALGSTALVVLTGLFKVAAHVVSLPGGLMGAVTVTHDIATVAMLAFFLAHVLFAAILPMGWPMLKSMFTGYVTVEHAKAEHAGWYARLAGEKKSAARDRDAA